MWEVKCSWEHVNKLAVISLLVNVVCNQLANKVLPCASRSVQREHQRLLRVIIVHKSTHRFKNDIWSNVLSKEFVFQVSLQTLRIHSRKSTGLVTENVTEVRRGLKEKLFEQRWTKQIYPLKNWDKINLLFSEWRNCIDGTRALSTFQMGGQAAGQQKCVDLHSYSNDCCYEKPS